MAASMHAELDLEFVEPVRGSLTGESGVAHSFTGWLEFHAAVEAVAREMNPATEGPDPSSSA